jgi:hypothetical protein
MLWFVVMVAVVGVVAVAAVAAVVVVAVVAMVAMVATGVAMGTVVVVVMAVVVAVRGPIVFVVVLAGWVNSHRTIVRWDRLPTHVASSSPLQPVCKATSGTIGHRSRRAGHCDVWNRGTDTRVRAKRARPVS